AALAVLAAAALWPVRYLRWPAAVLAALIVVSTVTTGWHYVSDVLGGLALAALSLAVARGYLRLARVGSWGFWKRGRTMATGALQVTGSRCSDDSGGSRRGCSCASG